MRPTRRFSAMIAALLLSQGLLTPKLLRGGDESGWASELEAWRQRRFEGLRSEEGWLSLVALSWLEEGSNSIGSDPDGWIVLPDKAPASLGAVVLEGEAIWLELAPGVGLTHQGAPVTGRLRLSPDTAEDGPTVVELGDLLFYAIEREGRFGIRAKDRQHPLRLAFEGIDRFPPDPAWRLEARFEENPPGTTIPVANIVGMLIDEPSWGRLAFEVAGETHRLDVVARPGDGRLFVIFADATTGDETYGAGRYIYTAPPDGDGRVELDFNRAYNPPCVFSPYATCPLPPRSNYLPFRVEAGEKNWVAPVEFVTSATDDH